MSSPDVLRVGHRNPISFVRYHEDAAVGTVFGAQAAPDAVVLYDDLKVLASMNGVDGTSDHAMWIRAGPTGGSDHKIIQALSGPEQARYRNTVRLRPMLLDTALGACVAPRAVIQVEYENALTLIQTLRDVIIEDSVTHRRTVQTSERLLDYLSAKDVKFAQHLKKIGTAKLRQLQLIQRGASRAAHSWWKDSG